MPYTTNSTFNAVSSTSSSAQSYSAQGFLKAKKDFKMADIVVKIIGSWKFIIIQSIILFLWTIFNIIAIFEHWDPYPFILLNLVLSLQAAYAAPIIMMSQNRQAERDRIEAHNDFLINQKAEKEIQTILNHLEQQNKILMQLQLAVFNEKKQ